ncbi:LppY/LpqO family protein [Streptomyces aidingensis]|uniref:DUF1259 domain-containing protein n=1 Tax=Streptomyces aidingensis TaxID=910347 RepID=A0A1I1SL28_9ACTN|nr:LppY/LpqO family protein [Streptomyces aidingensis]SFD47185.1 protein of unknown function [Streptomyces aidingensis]
MSTQKDRENRDADGGRRTTRRGLMAALALAPLAAGAVGAARAAAAGPHGAEGAEGAGGPVRPVPTTPADWQHVWRLLGGIHGMRGPLVSVVSILREDLRVVTEGVVLAPAVVGLHLSFVRYADGRTLLMGDLAVTEDELQDVGRELHRHGIVQTAVHKHVLAQQPPVWWCHIHAHAHEPVELARGVRAVVERTGLRRGPGRPAAPGGSDPAPETRLDLDTAGIDAALGFPGRAANGVYQSLLARRETIVDDGRVLPDGLGSMTAFNFQPLGRGRAALIGDVAMVAEEVPEVLRRLGAAGVDLVSLHSHSLAEDPRLFFVHNWAVGDAVAIARALRPAVDATRTVPVPVS